MTETSPLGTVSTLRPEQEALPPEEQTQLRAKAGHGIFGIAMKIVDEDGKELPWDGVSSGELKVRGPWVCSGYFRLDDSPAHSEPGWFATGDVAVIHPNGFLQITDRAKDVIKSGGEWISSVDLENCACGHADVLMAAAIGVRHPKWDERPILLVVPRPGSQPPTEVDPRAPRAAFRQVAVAGRDRVRRGAADDGDWQDQQAVVAGHVWPDADACREGVSRRVADPAAYERITAVGWRGSAGSGFDPGDRREPWTASARSRPWMGSRRVSRINPDPVTARASLA